MQGTAKLIIKKMMQADKTQPLVIEPVKIVEITLQRMGALNPEDAAQGVSGKRPVKVALGPDKDKFAARLCFHPLKPARLIDSAFIKAVPGAHWPTLNLRQKG